MQQAPTRRERKKQAVRQALEEAALRLFDRQGFAGTTIDQIADEADVSRSTFFRYFGSKEAVLFDAYDDGGAALSAHLMSRPPDEGPLAAFEGALIDLSNDQSAEDGRELAAMRHSVIESDDQLRLRREAFVHRWRFSLAATLAAREGLDEPQRQHLLAAAVGIAVTERLTEIYTSGTVTDPPEELIRSEFALLRKLAT